MTRLRPAWRPLALVAETYVWHAFAVGFFLIGAGLVGALAVLVVASVNAATVVALDRRRQRAGVGADGATAASDVGGAGRPAPPRAAPVLAGYVGLHRLVTLLSHAIPLWAAAQLAPAALAIGWAGWGVGLVAMRAVLRSPEPTRLVHVVTGLLLVGSGVDLWTYLAPPDAQCREVIAREGVRPLMLFRDVRDRPDPGGDDPLYVGECVDPRRLAVDPADGSLLVTCMVEPAGPQNALLRVHPDRPGVREEIRDEGGYQAVALPGHDRVVFSAYGSDRLRLLDRETLADVHAVPLHEPVGVTYDAASDRLLVAYIGEELACLVAVDPATGEVLARTEATPPGVAERPACTPHDVLPLPGDGRIFVSNFAGNLTWMTYDYETLEVEAAHQAWPARDAVLSPAGDEIFLAIPFVGRVDVLDRATLAPRRRLRTDFGAAVLRWADDGSLLVGNYARGTLRRLDPATGATLAEVPVGRKVRDLRPSPAGDRLYALSACGLFELDPALLGLGGEPGGEGAG